MSSTKSESFPYLHTSLALSLVVHLLFFLFFFRATPEPLPAPAVFEISFAPERSIKRQIVTEPDTSRTRTTPPKEPPKFLAEKDSFTDREQIKRGMDPNAGQNLSPTRNISPPSPPSPQTQQAQESQSSSKENAQPPRLRQLTLDAGTLYEKFGKETDRTEESKPIKNPMAAQQKSASYQAFSRPPGSGASVFGARGAPDHIPSLPDGDITLLNAKAEQFAVFVRRVALQVFASLRQSGWEHLTAQDISTIANYTTVRAVLSPKGEPLSVSIEGLSGSRKFDEILLSSSKKGARDPNPPEKALGSDGNIHFIFRARSWSRFAHDARAGFPVEQRWILLETGLE